MYKVAFTLSTETPFGSLPTLSVDGVTICQSLAIARYLAKEFGERRLVCLIVVLWHISIQLFSMEKDDCTGLTLHVVRTHACWHECP